MFILAQQSALTGLTVTARATGVKSDDNEIDIAATASKRNPALIVRYITLFSPSRQSPT
jgi:hypothetical protein